MDAAEIAIVGDEHDAACKRLVLLIEQAARLLNLAALGDDIGPSLTFVQSADHQLYEARLLIDPLLER